MQVATKKINSVEVELTIEISSPEFGRFFERAILRLTKELEVAGFRKGKVPKEISLREIGQDKILAEAARLAIHENYPRAVSENKFEPISSPQIEILKLAAQNPLIFRARFFVLPEIQLPDYRALAGEIKKRKILISERDCEESLNWLQKSRSKLHKTGRGAQLKDLVEIEFSAPEIEGGKIQRDAFLLGQGHLISGFEENLAGMKAGSEKNFSLRFPQAHHSPALGKSLSGKKIFFKVKMQKVSEVELPELNDDWARSLGRFKDLLELKQNLRKGLKLEKERNESQKIQQLILDRIAEKTKVELPSPLVEREKERLSKELKAQAKERMNLSFEDYLQEMGKSEKELAAWLDSQARKRVKEFLLLREIARQEKIEAGKEEVEARVNQLLGKYPNTARTKGDIDLAKLKDYTEEVIRNEKTLAKLESFAKKPQ